MAERALGGAGRDPRGGVGRLEAMPLRRKLDILVGAPLAAVLVLLVPVTWNKFSAAEQWRSAADAMRVDEQVNMLINNLETEEAAALGLQGLAGRPGSSGLDSVQTLHAAAAVTDRQLSSLQTTLHPAPSSALGQALADVVWEIQGVNGARQAAMNAAAVNNYIVQTDYGTAVQNLYNSLGLDQLAGAGGPAAFAEAEFDFLYTADLKEHDREVDLLALTNNAVFDQQSGSSSLDATDVAYLEQDDGVAQSESNRFGAVSSGTDLSAFDATAGTADQDFINSEQASLETALADTSPAVSVSGVLLTDEMLPVGQAGSGDRGLVQAAMNASKQRGTMEAQVTTDLVEAAQRQADISLGYAYALAAGALLLLLLLVTLEVRVRRSVVRPMLALTRAARQVAEVTRADLERVADEDEGSDAIQAVPTFDTVPVTTRDEVGNLAEAFNRVQDTAVRVLERQIAIRRNTAEMFGNVGRRIHNLTGRQLALIDAAEREETDPSVLERLYRIDHLAVRLQRGADSLMLLSGETEPVLSDAPLRLTDVVRSAVGRVEGYQRVVLSAEGDVTVAPAAVGDLTLIVAELVENAVSFSPATSSVDISVRPARSGARIEIVDHGVGMTAARLDEENARLVRRERLDLAPTKVLGLFVVGRLARRSGIAVRLSATDAGGVTVRLEIGRNLLFDTPEPPAPRRTPAKASRSVPPGTLPTALPEQRAAREPAIEPPAPRTGPHSADAPTAAPSANGHTGSGPQSLPVRRRPAPAPAPEALEPADGRRAPAPGPEDAPPALPRRTAAAPAEDAASTAAAPPAEPGHTTGFAALAEPGHTTEYAAPDGAASAHTEPPQPAEIPAEGAPTALPRRSRSRAAVREPALPASAPLAAAHRLDAEAARAAVEEFEAGVEEALRVSAQDLPTLRASDEPEGIRP